MELHWFRRFVCGIDCAAEALRIMRLRETELMRCGHVRSIRNGLAIPRPYQTPWHSVERLFVDSKMSNRDLMRGARWLKWAGLVHWSTDLNPLRREPFAMLNDEGRLAALHVSKLRSRACLGTLSNRTEKRTERRDDAKRIETA